jgi:hypothetical protein
MCTGISMGGASQTSTLNVAKYLKHTISRNRETADHWEL